MTRPRRARPRRQRRRATREGQARQAAWVNVGPCETVVPHPDAPDRLTQAVANLHDVGLWPWAWGGDTDEARS